MCHLACFGGSEIRTNVEWVGTIGAGPLLEVKRKLAYAPRQRGFSSVPDPNVWSGRASRSPAPRVAALSTGTAACTVVPFGPERISRLPPNC